MTVLIVLSECNFYIVCISLTVANILWPHFITMIPCDLYMRHFYVLNSIIDVFHFFYKEGNEIKEANKFLNNVSFGSSYKSLSKTVCVL